VHWGGGGGGGGGGDGGDDDDEKRDRSVFGVALGSGSGSCFGGLRSRRSDWG